MNKRLIRNMWLTTMLLMLLWPSVMASAANNLLVNGDFEDSNGGVPAHWSTQAWFEEDGATRFTLDDSASADGGQSAAIFNDRDNHARWVQSIKVEANKIYRFAGKVKAESFRADAAGAHIYVDGVAEYYPQIHDTAGEWVDLEFYGKTTKGQKEIVVGISAGGYGSLNTGKAWFDSLSVEKVKSAPGGATVYSLKASSIGGSSDSDAKHDVSILSAMLFAALFIAAYGVIHRYLLRNAAGLEKRGHLPAILTWCGFGAALAIRIVIALSHGGYANDMALFVHWSEQVVEQGISGFYHTDMFVDYPPGYIYVLYALGTIKEWFGIAQGSSGMLLLYKLPAILADLATAAVIFTLARRKWAHSASLGLSMLYLFNPAIILDSAAWGQVDSVFALVLSLSIAAITERKIGRASVWYAIAALIKPQAFIFMPVLLLAFVRWRQWQSVAVSAYYGFGAFILLALPFFWSHGGLRGLYELYKGTLSSYPYATLNAFNFYTLSGGNWKALESKFLFVSYQAWGTAFILAAVAAVVVLAFVKSGKSWIASFKENTVEDRSFYLALVLIAVVFVMVTKMHERYMFPVMALSLLAYVQLNDRRLLHLFVGFSLTNFINMSYVLDFSAFTTNVPTDGIALLCALSNIGLLLYALYIGYDRLKRGRTLPVEPFQPEERREEMERTLAEFGEDAPAAPEQGPQKSKLSRKEWYWLGGITVVYAIVALINLGSFKAPVTVWQPASSGDSFYVDLGEVKTIDRITSFGGVGQGKYTYEFALTANSWSNPVEVDNDHVYVFAWKSQKLDLEARYVKLTVTKAGFSMHEFGIYEAGSKEPLPIVDIVRTGQQPKRGSLEELFDEQSLMQYSHSFMKGSYFDEIYHARTAYEHLEGIVAYESTHPPLGKLLIAIGIKLFGFSPFGWRIVGTLVGVAMLPLMYMMARRLFGKPLYATIATGLLALDFMHFAQTRIATIDVYGVFFIMLMFYFMQKYASMSFYRYRLAATLAPLGLAGLFFGIGVASKWIVIYGGAGLALMLALTLKDRLAEYVAARRALRQNLWQSLGLDESKLRHIVSVFPKYTILTLLSCLGFYIGVPAGIYALANIPVLSVMNGGYTWKALVDYQVNMYNYHSNLVSEHPFSSSWWEWPFMKRPVWYYLGPDMPDTTTSTIVSLGNPIIWWSGIFLMIATIVISIRSRDKAIYMIWIAFLAQYVPWMLVPRETFLYHYFAMVPFVILSIVYIFKAIEERMPRFHKVRNAYIAVAAAMFILFYPALSGMTVPKWYVDALLRWFPSWVF